MTAEGHYGKILYWKYAGGKWSGLVTLTKAI